MNSTSVDITGMGCVCAPGPSLPEVMAAIYAGRRDAHPPRKIMADTAASYPVFEVDSHLSGLDDAATRTSRLALQAAQEALHQSGWRLEDLQKYRVGVCLGTTVGCTLNNEPFYRNYRGGEFPGLEAISTYLQNNPALYLARKLRLKGPLATIANACSSGADAIGLGKTWLENDLCDLVIAGGSDELSRITYLGFISLLITSARACRPFDKNRDGLNLGEGSGIVILERNDFRKKRGGAALAGVAGYGTFADAWHPTAPHPEGHGLRRAIKTAINEAGISAADICCINAHGTSTPNNDQVEGLVVSQLLPHRPPLVSTKAYTGHTLGAAGAIEAIFAVQALRDGRLPATAGFAEYDEQCFITPTTENTPVSGDYALSTSLAFGGNNTALVLRRAG